MRKFHQIKPPCSLSIFISIMVIAKKGLIQLIQEINQQLRDRAKDLRITESKDCKIKRLHHKTNNLIQTLWEQLKFIWEAKLMLVDLILGVELQLNLKVDPNNK